jgi:hypothetical protein
MSFQDHKLTVHVLTEDNPAGKILLEARYSIYTVRHTVLRISINLMRIRILLFTLIRIQIQIQVLI